MKKTEKTTGLDIHTVKKGGPSALDREEEEGGRGGGSVVTRSLFPLSLSLSPVGDYFVSSCRHLTPPFLKGKRQSNNSCGKGSTPLDELFRVELDRTRTKKNNIFLSSKSRGYGDAENVKTPSGILFSELLPSSIGALKRMRSTHIDYRFNKQKGERGRETQKTVYTSRGKG